MHGVSQELSKLNSKKKTDNYKEVNEVNWNSSRAFDQLILKLGVDLEQNVKKYHDQKSLPPLNGQPRSNLLRFATAETDGIKLSADKTLLDEKDLLNYKKALEKIDSSEYLGKK